MSISAVIFRVVLFIKNKTEKYSCPMVLRFIIIMTLYDERCKLLIIGQSKCSIHSTLPILYGLYISDWIHNIIPSKSKFLCSNPILFNSWFPYITTFPSFSPLASGLGWVICRWMGHVRRSGEHLRTALVRTMKASRGIQMQGNSNETKDRYQKRKSNGKYWDIISNENGQKIRERSERSCLVGERSCKRMKHGFSGALQWRKQKLKKKNRIRRHKHKPWQTRMQRR